MSAEPAPLVCRGAAILLIWGLSTAGCTDGALADAASDEGLTSGGTSGHPSDAADLGGVGSDHGSSGGGSSGGSSSSAGGSAPADGGDSNVGIDDPRGERLEVPGGTFSMGRSESGGDACPAEQTCAPGEVPEHAVTVGRFWLDRYEVTVERFRAFYESYPQGDVPDGSGAHPAIPGSGWHSDFAADLPEDQSQLLAELACDEEATFSPSAGTRDDWPVNCVSWPVAFAFCIAAGGRLATEAEWEFAAAGGDENRLYPWGSEEATPARASFFPGSLGPVGDHTDGRARYGHEDLAGGVWEWALDWLDTNWYAGSGATCSDCARVSSGTHRVLRGGAHSFEAVTLRAAARSGDLPASRQTYVGFRCAYDEP